MNPVRTPEAVYQYIKHYVPQNAELALVKMLATLKIIKALYTQAHGDNRQLFWEKI